MIIGIFSGLGLTFEEASEIVNDINGAKVLAAGGLAYMLTPYTMATLGTLLPIGAWILAGFTGGLITQSPRKATAAAIFSVLIAWGTFVLLTSSQTELSVADTFCGFKQASNNIWVDVVAVIGLCLFPAIIGGLFTWKKEPPRIWILPPGKHRHPKPWTPHRLKADLYRVGLFPKKANMIIKKVEKTLRKLEQPIRPHDIATTTYNTLVETGLKEKADQYMSLIEKRRRIVHGRKRRRH